MTNDETPLTQQPTSNAPPSHALQDPDPDPAVADVLALLKSVVGDSALVSGAQQAQALAAATGIMLTNAVANQQLTYMTAQAANVRNVIIIQDELTKPCTVNYTLPVVPATADSTTIVDIAD